ncbi:phosphoinositide 3-kinase adapter protein 1 isoform X2 [Hoplias malabaricus]|uniref:phosphoinositide 3-kinase adapter protein 1 isoform X2 n=1 Tax=Hoplias malabaricus TaxID=27720 RepID=UPI0034631473
MCTVLIVCTSESQEWATYLRLVLEGSHHFHQDSITLYLADEENSLQDEDYPLFHSTKCILILVSEAFLDMCSELEVQEVFQRFLYPPYKVVAFMCGVSENSVLYDYFEHWDSWRKLDSEDEPSQYISTVLEVISEEYNTECDQVQYENQHQDQYQDEYQDQDQDQGQDQDQIQWRTDYEIPPLKQSTELTASGYDPIASEEPKVFDQSQSLSQPQSQFQSLEENPHVSDGNVTQPESPGDSAEEQICLTVQPPRILCGTQVDVYLILAKKLNTQDSVEVEFCCKHSTKRVPAGLVNEYIVTAQSPDMPAGDVSLNVYTNESVVCSTIITYYTEMEEICSYLEKVMDPIKFMCQAFNISSNSSEALDNLLTNSLNNQMPANGLQIFGIDQLEQGNILENQRKVELPTLLHFSAKYGLKKLTSKLLQCPGALQAYSVVNKNGDYPNTLAEKSGFSDLRQFMDNYVETVDLVKSHLEVSMENQEDTDIYETMANAPQDFVTKFTIQEDIYESMMKLNPELYEESSSALNESQNPEEAMLRKFFEVKPEHYSETNQEDQVSNGYPCTRPDEAEDEFVDIYGVEDEEDPYKMCFQEDIYDTVDDQESSSVLNRPPAPIPRPSAVSDAEDRQTYISTVFSTKNALYSVSSLPEKKPPKAPVCPLREDSLSSAHDPYAGMKTPGQRQLISLQERVKVGELTVEEAVQEFKAWQFDQEKRSQSIRFQQDNLQKLRNSIIRRHKERGKSGKEVLEITAPMQRSLPWGTHINVECSVYEPTPRTVSQPPPVSRPPQRGTWQTGSASSTSSSGSNRLSNISYSSGADGDLDETQEPPVPPRPIRPGMEAPPTLPPPRIPRRPPERFPEAMLNERYVSSPSRGYPHAPPQRSIPPPPVPRRPR